MTVMEERFELASQRILEIEKEKRMPEQFQRYFAENADYLGVLLEEYKWVASGAMREARASSPVVRPASVMRNAVKKQSADMHRLILYFIIC